MLGIKDNAERACCRGCCRTQSHQIRTKICSLALLDLKRQQFWGPIHDERKHCAEYRITAREPQRLAPKRPHEETPPRAQRGFPATRSREGEPHWRGRGSRTLQKDLMPIGTRKNKQMPAQSILQITMYMSVQGPVRQPLDEQIKTCRRQPDKTARATSTGRCPWEGSENLP